MIFLSLALVLGLTAAWMATRVGPAETTGPQMAPLVMLRTDVSVATALTREHLRVVDWPAEHVPTGAITSLAVAEGRVSRRPLAAGEPLLEAGLFAEGAAGGLMAVISPERRAVSVKVDNVVGVAGFISPGARVDVLATLRRVDMEKALPFSKVILQDVKVLAIDQKLEEARGGDPVVVNVVTLEVDPVQAEHLIYAAHEGRLQLALRSPGDDEMVDTKSIGVRDVLGSKKPVAKKARKRSAPRKETTTVQLLQGSELQIKNF